MLNGMETLWTRLKIKQLKAFIGWVKYISCEKMGKFIRLKKEVCSGPLPRAYARHIVVASKVGSFRKEVAIKWALVIGGDVDKASP